MITTDEAREIIISTTIANTAEKRALTDSLGKILRETVHAPVSLPAFDQSAMDGFALRFDDLRKFSSFNIIGESSAGNPFTGEAQNGEVVRIFTGAVVPSWADHIIVVEMTEVTNTECVFNDPNGVKGQHIRKRGSQIEEKEIAVLSGTRINPATIGFLYSFGFTEVQVNRDLRISILVTGNELKKPGESVSHGEICESNSVMLSAACRSVHQLHVNMYHCRDNEEALTAEITKLLSESDILIVTGGVSAGDYDFTAKAFTNCGVKKHFHKIAQKPGKPMYYGSTDSAHVFGLPGNPAAALTCFYEYVYPCINKLNGCNDYELPQVYLPLVNGWSKKPGLANYLKGQIHANGVELLTGQESFILKSFAQSDCLVYIPEESSKNAEGSIVETHLLPFH